MAEKVSVMGWHLSWDFDCEKEPPWADVEKEGCKQRKQPVESCEGRALLGIYYN